MAERRRSDRYPSRLPVDVVERKGDRRVHTVDVGRHGIFVEMDDPPSERLLLQLKVHLPAGPTPVLAVVARRVPAGTPERKAGAGLQFFVLAPEAKDRWDAYVAGLRGEAKAPADQRTHPRRLASFLVRMKDVNRLRDVFTRDISEGGLFVSTPLVKPVDSPVSLIVVHPATDEEFELEGTVARIQEGPPRGMGIRLAHFGADEKDDFKKFVDTGLAALRWRSAAQSRPAAPIVPPAPAHVPAAGDEEEIDLGDLDAGTLGEAHGLSAVEREIARSLEVEPADPEEEALREEIAREPSSLEPRVRLAARLLGAGQAERAVEIAESAVALDPGHPVALIALARSLAGVGRFEDADASFGKALKAGHPGDHALAASIARGLGRS